MCNIHVLMESLLLEWPLLLEKYHIIKLNLASIKPQLATISRASYRLRSAIIVAEIIRWEKNTVLLPRCTKPRNSSVLPPFVRFKSFIVANARTSIVAHVQHARRHFWFIWISYRDTSSLVGALSLFTVHPPQLRRPASTLITVR